MPFVFATTGVWRNGGSNVRWVLQEARHHRLSWDRRRCERSGGPNGRVRSLASEVSIEHVHRRNFPMSGSSAEAKCEFGCGRALTVPCVMVHEAFVRTRMGRERSVGPRIDAVGISTIDGVLRDDAQHCRPDLGTSGDYRLKPRSTRSVS